MTMFRSRMLYAAFAAGAILGCLAASALGPQFASADRLDLLAQSEGLPHLNQKDIAEIKEMLGGLTQTEDGQFVFDKPVRFAKPVELGDSTVAVELLVSCAPDADSARPSFKVCGPAVFENHLAQRTVVVNDRGPEYPEPDFLGPAFQVVGRSKFSGDPGTDPLMLIMPDMHMGPALAIEGKTLLAAPAELSHEVAFEFVGRSKFSGDPGTDPLMVIMPEMHMGPALAIEGNAVLSSSPDFPDTTGQLQVKDSFRIVEVNRNGIELLVIVNPDNPVPVSRASLLIDPDLGSSFDVGHIDADTIRAFSIEEFQLPPPIEAGSF